MKESRKLSVFVINSYFKYGTFKAVKECKVVNYCKYVKGVPFVDRRWTKGLPFWKGLGVGSWGGAYPYKTFLVPKCMSLPLCPLSVNRGRIFTFRPLDEILRMLIIFRWILLLAPDDLWPFGPPNTCFVNIRSVPRTVLPALWPHQRIFNSVGVGRF